MRRARLAPVLVLGASLAACGGTSGGSAPDAAAGGPGDGAPGLTDRCDGPCRLTDLTAALAATRHLDRAYYGVTAAAGGATLHVEAYLGGGAGCPTASSPTPAYTLVLGALPVPTSDAALTSPANVLDYQGDLLGGPLGAAATSARITPVAARVCATCGGQPPPRDPDGLLAVDLELAFAAGTLTGHLFATHCDSLDTPP